ncbi:Glioma tumor suppressor candidate region gene 2 protein [Chelonia mydas]|uniref:Ribosome biogenesis protein NOP53 n=1 Tax=Chelonia mydas TaxID=8469 RepID=M7ATJ3_CHEMY|nr:Glioma tumor suppressor candidate region gene 2 protein [Chelonia mydas]
MPGPRSQTLPGIGARLVAHSLALCFWTQGPSARGLVAEKPDESLFFLDTGSEEKDRKLNQGKEKPLRIDLILQPDSKVPAPKDILAHQVPNGKKLKRKQQLWERLAERGVVPREQRLLQARLQKARPARAEAAHGQGAGPEPAGGFYDIWSDANPLDRPLAGQDAWFLEQTKKQRVRRPARLEKKPSELPAVEVIPAGGSYNPTFQAHQRRQGSRAQWLEQGVGPGCGGCCQGYEDPDLEVQLSTELAESLRTLQVGGLGALFSGQGCGGAAPLLTLPPPPGSLSGRYEDPDLEVQLSTELAESLRTLKPEGSVLRDRFKSLQKRNLIEPRERAK